MVTAEWPEEVDASLSVVKDKPKYTSASSTSGAPPSNTVFVRNLPYEWLDAELLQHFENVGPVRRAFVVTTKPAAGTAAASGPSASAASTATSSKSAEQAARTAGGVSRGFGFVEFAHMDDAGAAIEQFHGKLVAGRKLLVEFAVTDKTKVPVVDKKQRKLEQRDQHKLTATAATPTAAAAAAAAPSSSSTPAPSSSASAPSTVAKKRATMVDDSDSETSGEDDDSDEDSDDSDDESDDESDDDDSDDDEDSDSDGEEEPSRAAAAKPKTAPSKPVSTAASTTAAAAATATASSSPSTTSSSLLLSHLPLELKTITSLLKHFALTPTYVDFPSPESTNKYKAARLSFRTVQAAAHAQRIFAGTILDVHGKIVADPLSGGETAAPAESSSSSSSESAEQRFNLRCLPLSEMASRVILRNMPFFYTESNVRTLCAPFGKIVSINVPVNPNSAPRPVATAQRADAAAPASNMPIARSSTAPRNRGFAFVLFDSLESAHKCIHTLNGTLLSGRPIAVDWSLGKSDFVRREELLRKLEVRRDRREQTTKTATATEESAANASDEESSSSDVSEGDSDDDDASNDDESAKNDDDDDDDDEDDSDSSDDDEDDDDDDDDEDGDNASKKPTAPTKSTPKPVRESDASEGLTIFIRNLAYHTTEEELKAKFSAFGPVLYALIVQERVSPSTNGEDGSGGGSGGGEMQVRSKGVAFVKFKHKTSVDAVLKKSAAGAKAADDARRRRTRVTDALSEHGVVLGGRVLNIALAVDRNEASRLNDKNEYKRDKRNLYLAKEGVLVKGTPAAEHMSEEDLERRQRYYREKKKKLENPNFSVSRVRLSVRNLPLHVDEKELRQIFHKAAVKGVREELARETAKLPSPLHEPLPRVAIKMKQVKIERDQSRLDANGNPRSKRYGFIEFTEHAHALLALRMLNNHPKILRSGGSSEEAEEGGGRGSSSRGSSGVIVEFALDDARKVKVHLDRMKKVEKFRAIRAEREEREQEHGAQEEEGGGEESGESSTSSGKSRDSSKDRATMWKERRDVKRARAGEQGADGKRFRPMNGGVSPADAKAAAAAMAAGAARAAGAAAAARAAATATQSSSSTSSTVSSSGGDAGGATATAAVSKNAKKNAKKREREETGKGRRDGADTTDKFDDMVQEYKRRMFSSTGGGAGGGAGGAAGSSDQVQEAKKRWFDL